MFYCAENWAQGSFHQELDQLASKCWQAPGMSETNPSDSQLDWKPTSNITLPQ